MSEEAELREKEPAIDDFLRDTRGKSDEQGHRILKESVRVEGVGADKRLKVGKSEVHADGQDDDDKSVLAVIPSWPVGGALLVEKISEPVLAGANATPGNVKT